MDEVARYRKRLAPLEADARGQRWANERPWHTKTHVWSEDGVVVVDLHDLGAAIAKRAVQEVLAAGPPGAGALLFVHGRGRHSPGGAQVLRGVVSKELKLACTEAPAWSIRAVGAGRIAWITDRKRAPRSVTGDWGLGSWAGVVGLVTAIGTAVGHAFGWW